MWVKNFDKIYLRDLVFWMDALLRVEKNNKKRKALTGSTISRASFGSLLESIK